MLNRISVIKEKRVQLPLQVQKEQSDEIQLPIIKFFPNYKILGSVDRA